MSILIKGMEMPKNCAGCFLRFGQCSRRIYMENRPSDCPLIEVPEPHGRLIDADALMEKFLETYTEYERKKLLVFYAAEVKQEVADMITDAPTIIPAEEDE